MELALVQRLHARALLTEMPGSRVSRGLHAGSCIEPRTSGEGAQEGEHKGWWKSVLGG